MENEVETLVILSPGFPESEADSTCIPAMQLFVKALKQVCPGLNVIVLTFQYPYTPNKYQWHGVEVIAIGGKNKGGFFHFVTWVKVWLNLKKLNKNHRLIGLLSLWCGECALIGNYFAKKHKLSHYCWLQGQDAKKTNRYFNRIKPKADSLIALSDFIAAEVKRNYGISPLYTIPLGIDTSLFGVAPLKRDIDILGAGSLIPLKQYHVFIETIAFLKKFFPEIKAVICGDGPEMERLQAMVTSRGLQNNIVFAGELPHKQVLVLMQRSKIFLHTSNYEGFGAVLAEALYAGAHVVSFCKPMDRDFRNHHVVNTAQQMNTETYAILKNKKLNHQPVLMYTVQQIAKNIVGLFADNME